MTTTGGWSVSEYTEVEQPFLRQLQALGWEIIDQGHGESIVDALA